MSLEGELTATVDGDDVEFTFTVRNDGDDAVEMEFRDAQTFDVVVHHGGAEVWRWGHGQMFAQMITTETLAPGETATFEATWEDPDDGEYEATAELTATDADCEATTSFTV